MDVGKVCNELLGFPLYYASMAELVDACGLSPHGFTPSEFESQCSHTINSKYLDVVIVL